MITKIIKKNLVWCISLRRHGFPICGSPKNPDRQSSHSNPVVLLRQFIHWPVVVSQTGPRAGSTLPLHSHVVQRPIYYLHKTIPHTSLQDKLKKKCSPMDFQSIHSCKLHTVFLCNLQHSYHILVDHQSC